jgi:hypothetical protein
MSMGFRGRATAGFTDCPRTSGSVALRRVGRCGGSQAFDEQSGQLAILLDAIDLIEFQREHGCRVRLRGRRRGELMDVDDLSEFEDFITTTA